MSINKIDNDYTIHVYRFFFSVSLYNTVYYIPKDLFAKEQ